MNHWNIYSKATSSRYALECRSKIKEILDRGKIPILEGGSGFYIQSVFNRKLLVPRPGYDKFKARAEKIMEKNYYDPRILDEYDPENSLKITKQFSKYRLVNSLAIGKN